MTLADIAAMDAARGNALVETRRLPSLATFKRLARKRGWSEDEFEDYAKNKKWAV